MKDEGLTEESCTRGSHLGDKIWHDGQVFLLSKFWYKNSLFWVGVGWGGWGGLNVITGFFTVISIRLQYSTINLSKYNFSLYF